MPHLLPFASALVHNLRALTGTGNGSAQALTVYGQATAGQFVAPGAYSGTITAAVTY